MQTATAAAYRPTWAPTPPAETGNTYADGMAAIRYVLAHNHTFPAELDLSPRQLAAALHVAPIATARPQPRRDASGELQPVQEHPGTLAAITAAVSAIAARHRRLTAMDAAALAQLAALFETVRADDKPNAGPMAPKTPTPTPQPPMAPAVPAYHPQATAPAPQPTPAYRRTPDRKDADTISF